ncbi:AAA family ATPase [Streptomyces sp. NPDC001530]|uniref:helix-turn-helix transcriptional regulator n=1 Tax=Streptomyces sp. NPDC001530 TaxID=3364582 RepID=UPI0036B98D0C
MTSLGRTAAVSILGAALADCEKGDLRVVLIEGATGCGKSSLIDAFSEQAATAGNVVLSAVGFRGERTVPLGLLRQLANSARAEALRAVLENAAAPTRIEAIQSFCARLRELSADAPVVLCVDDVQDADDESLQYLQYAIRHARSARILVVLTTSPHGTAQDPAFTTELLRQPNFQRVQLGLLSPAEVAEALAEREPAAGEDIATALYDISGGNPLLLRALLEEQEPAAEPDGEPVRRGTPAAGGPFAQAVITCLHRSGPSATGVAQAVALLGDRASAAHITGLLGIGCPAGRQALASLQASGLLDGMRFRHPSSRAAVLDSIDPDTRTELHRRAAQLLRQTDSPATAVAEHLQAAAAGGAQWHDAPWAIAVLCDAAEEFLAGDNARLAMPLLELAYETCSDEQYRNAIKIKLSRITLRLNPAASEKHLSAPLKGLRTDQLATEHVRPLAQLLLVQGRIPEAADVLEHAGATANALAPDAAGEEPGSAADSWATPLHDLSAALDTDVTVGERLLQSTKLTDATMAPLIQALNALIHSGQPERALLWSRNLLEEANRSQAPGWSAVFATLHSRAALRLGDLRTAHAHAAQALKFLPEKNGSAFHYAPLGLLIRTCDVMGRQTEASRQIDQLVPGRLLTTLHGLDYLHARGLHYLAGNQPHAALADFFEVGRLMRCWGVDRPAFLPWRSDAAEALLRLGDPQRAEQLVLQQLSTPDARRPWVLGISLRLRAKTSGPERRASLLSRAIDELRRSGDRLETARAMADLGQAMQADGSPAKGSAMIRAAWSLAKECGAGTLCEEPLPDISLAEPLQERTDLGPGDATKTSTKLSSSEQRVATLAAQGLTNREISMKLYITVSTVEQHLTRVYRKLNISRRRDLPVDMQLYSQESA